MAWGQRLRPQPGRRNLFRGPAPFRVPPCRAPGCRLHGFRPEAYQVKDIVPGPSTGNIEAITAQGRRAFFTVIDVDHGRELWKTDGTTAGTTLVRDIYPGNGDSDPSFLCVTPGLLFFAANDPAVGWEVFRSDGAAAGTSPIGDLTPGPNQGSYGPICAGSLAFFALQVTGGWELWRTDGTAAGTAPVTGPFTLGPTPLTAVGAELFFWNSANGTPSGLGLWKSDGTPAGTVEVHRFGTWSPTKAYAAGGLIFFTIEDAAHGTELWASDGTNAGTRLVKDIVPGPGSTTFYELRPVGLRLFFAADDQVNGDELWVSDGTDAGTQRLDLAPGPASLFPQRLVAYQGEAFFVATDSASTDSIWRSDGTPAGTRKVAQVTASGYAFIRFLTPVKEKLFFVAEAADRDAELWRTDGTAEGTVLAADINPGPQGSFPYRLTAVGRRLFMTADDGVTSHELWAAPVSAFADVAPLDPFWSSIHALYDAGVTGGCATNPLRYCPSAVVSRETMAVLLLRAKEGAGYAPPPCTPPGPFSDVPCSSPYAPWIQELVARAVTGGCSSSPPAFCPSSPVDRAQMAVFLLRTAEGPAYLPPACTAPPFADVPCSSPFASWIGELARRGITSGCGNGNYCPAAPVTRAQMAAFLATTFRLPLP